MLLWLLYNISGLYLYTNFSNFHLRTWAGRTLMTKSKAASLSGLSCCCMINWLTNTHSHKTTVETNHRLWFKSTLLFIKATLSTKRWPAKTFFFFFFISQRQKGHSNEAIIQMYKQTQLSEEEHNMPLPSEEISQVLCHFVFFSPLHLLYCLSEDIRLLELPNMYVWLRLLCAWALARGTCLFWGGGMGGRGHPHGNRVLLFRLLSSL